MSPNKKESDNTPNSTKLKSKLNNDHVTSSSLLKTKGNLLENNFCQIDFENTNFSKSYSCLLYKDKLRSEDKK